MARGVGCLASPVAEALGGSASWFRHKFVSATALHNLRLRKGYTDIAGEMQVGVP